LYTDIAEKPLEQRHVRQPWIMRVETCLLDSEGDVGARDGQELERTHQTAIQRHVIAWQTVGGELVLDVDRRGRRFAV
jgi:hypothetical protein